MDSIEELLVAFSSAPAEHWVTRLQAGGVNAKVIEPPVVKEDGTVEGMPDPQDGVGILVNARVGIALEGARSDLFVLPQGAPQDGSPVGLDFLNRL